MKILDDIELMI